MEVYPSSKFRRSFKKLSRLIQERAIARDLVFRADIFDPRLQTHKLQGGKREEWAYSVDYSYRVKFIFFGGDAVVYIDIGTHSEIY